MLSAFTAEPIIELKQRDKSKIESILAHGDHLLVGLSTGALRIYRVNNAFEQDTSTSDHHDGSPEPKTKPTELLRELDKFSKYKVEQLAIFKEANILISLSSGLVSIHDLGTYELQEQLTRTKGTTLFAATSNIVHDATTNVPTLVSRLAVAVRRRLLLWSWHDGELAGDAQEFTLGSSIKSLTWASGIKILIGLNPNYVMLDIETQQQKNIVGPGSIGGHPGSERGTGTLSYIGMGSMVPTPLATGLGPDEMLLAKDVNTHFVDRNGESLGRRQIPWRSTPKAVGYSYPFLLALQEPSSSKGVLEVRNPQTLTLLQSIELSSAHLMQVPNPGISLAHQGKGFLVASDRAIWRMKGLHYDAQVDALVDAGQLDEAISLLEIIEETLILDKDGRLREIKMQRAQKLFDEGKFRDALDLFSEVSAPPERVIKLYPELIAGDLALYRPESPLESANSKANRPESISSKVSIERTKKQATDIMSTVSSIFKSNGNGNDKELKSAVRELQGFLADIRRRLSRFFDADQEVRSLSELGDGPQAEDNKNVIEHILEVPEQDENTMKEKLLETARLVDTTLFRAHMFATPSLAGSLFRITNHCDPEVVMTKLEETERYSELIDFLYGKRLHKKALERLQKFGQSDKTDEIDPQLHGPDRTVSYLQNLPPEMIDLILEFARWPMEVKPEVGMEIFVADTENAESLPRHKVLAFLESIDRAYAVRYLEHLIDELDDHTPDLHQRLATLYFEEISQAKEEEQRILVPRFLTLLRQSSQYSPAKMLALLPRDDPLFYEAMAIVYSKMGQHRQALQIYVFRLDDTSKAEEYCNQVYLQESTASAQKSADAVSQRFSTTQAQTEDPTSEISTIYALLLSLYLTPPPATPPEKQAEPKVSDALSLLTRHGPRLPATSTLSIIPTDLLIKELAPYLRGRIRTANTAMNDVRVIANLRKVEAVRVQARLLLGLGADGDPGADLGALGEMGMNETTAKGRRAKVIIDEERICRVCHKRLGGSVISAFPDGTVVHLGCQGRREQELRNAAGTMVR